MFIEKAITWKISKEIDNRMSQKVVVKFKDRSVADPHSKVLI